MKQRRQLLTALTLCFSSYMILLFTVFYSMVSAAQLQDPTRPPDFRQSLDRPLQQTPDKGWTLSSILISPQRRVAIINGSSVMVGDAVGSGKVLSINASEVIIEQGVAKITLTLLPKTFQTQIQKRFKSSDGGR